MKTIPVILAAALALSACTGESPALVADAPAAEALPVLVRSSVRSDEVLMALALGRLALDENGCIRIGGEADDAPGPFVVWHYDSTIERTEDGRIRIVDGHVGNAAFIGDEIAMSGGHGTQVPTGVNPAVPEACADGDFWVAGALLSEADRQRILERERNRVPAPSPE